MDLIQPCARVGYLDPNVDEDGTGGTDDRTANNQVVLSAQVSY